MNFAWISLRRLKLLLFFEFILKYFPEFINLGAYYDLAIRICILIVVKILLMIVFGRIEFCKGSYLRHYGLVEGTALVQFLFVLLSLLFLLFIMIKTPLRY